LTLGRGGIAYGFFTTLLQEGGMGRLVPSLLAAAFLAPLPASPAIAAELAVEVRTANGAPVRDAVVSLYPGGKPTPPGALRSIYRISQQNIQFSPFVLVVPVGAEVAFPNFDAVRHHVYSFSPAKRFELKLYAREQNRTVRFDKAGVVPLGCNIHDAMSAFVLVADTAFSAKTDGAGRVSFAHVPAGAVVARVWHPHLRAPANRIELRWTVPATGRLGHQVRVALRPPPPVHPAY
jgi:plastocyanin